MKRIILILMLCIVPFVYTSTALGIQFKDTSNHWAQGYINELSSRGYITGYTDGTFLPDKIMTRAEFISLLLRCKNNNPAYSYNSTNTAHWADAQINEAIRQGIIILSEYPQGFNKDSFINRSEAAAMIARSLGYQPNYTFASFKDSSLVNNNPYAGYIKVVHQEGIITGYPDGEFKPYNYISRAQACIIFTRYLAKLNSFYTDNYYNYMNPYYNYSPPSYSSYPSGTRIGTLTVDGYRYNPIYVPVYIDYKSTSYCVDDIEVISSNVVRLGGYNYYLSEGRLSVLLQGEYYRLEEVYWVNGVASLELSKDSYRYNDYYFKDISLSDIYAVYDEDGDKILRSDIDDIEFRISGKSTRYDLDEIEIDVDNNYIIIDNEEYKANRIDILVNKENSSIYYNWDLIEVRVEKDKLVFDCNVNSDSYIDHDDIMFIDDYDYEYNADDDVYIYVDGSYKRFRYIDVLDRYEFKYDGDTYDLIDSKIKIDGIIYYITSSRWNNGILELYID